MGVTFRPVRAGAIAVPGLAITAFTGALASGGGGGDDLSFPPRRFVALFRCCRRTARRSARAGRRG